MIKFLIVAVLLLVTALVGADLAFAFEPEGGGSGGGTYQWCYNPGIGWWRCGP